MIKERFKLDDQPILKIGWQDPHFDYYWIQVGVDGVDEITAREQYLADDCSILWLEVWKKGKIVSRWNSKNVDSVFYGE